jgi:hypothetical protein
MKRRRTIRQLLLAIVLSVVLVVPVLCSACKKAEEPEQGPSTTDDLANDAEHMAMMKKMNAQKELEPQ